MLIKLVLSKINRTITPNKSDDVKNCENETEILVENQNTNPEATALLSRDEKE